MGIPTPIPLRSPRESLGGYILLPRLIDKVRLLAQGQLPQTYVANVLKDGFTLDGRFLSFTGLNAEVLRQAFSPAVPMMRCSPGCRNLRRMCCFDTTARGSSRPTTLHVIVSSTEPALIRGLRC